MNQIVDAGLSGFQGITWFLTHHPTASQFAISIVVIVVAGVVFAVRSAR